MSNSKVFFRACSIVAAVLLQPATPAAGDTPSAAAVPPTESRIVTDHYFETTVNDPYRWLEDESSPEVARWNAAQNQHARSYLDSMPVRAPLHKELSRLIKAASPKYSSLRAAGSRILASYSDPQFQQPLLVALDANADPASRQVVLDPNKIDAKGLTAIDWFAPSRDGKWVAVSLSKNGSEDGTLHVYSIATGKESADVIPRVQYPTAGGSLAWAADGSGFWYTRYPGEDAKEADRHFFLQTYFHHLGSDWRKDPLVLGTADGLPRIAEIFLDNRFSDRAVLASVQKGDGGEWQQWLLRPDGSKVRIADFTDKIVAATLGPDQALYMVSHAGAPNGKVLKLPASATSLTQARVIVPASPAAIQADEFQYALNFTATRLLVNYIDGGPGSIHAYDLEGKAQGVLPLGDNASFGGLALLPQGDVLIGVSSYLKPDRYVRWSQAKNKVAETELAVTSPANFDDAEVVRVFATSKDGAKVPLSIVRKRGATLNGKNPTLLYGYGGYGVSMTPRFVGPPIRAWLDAGGVYVVANIRGGAEYGERWHTAGMSTHKQNVFDDFAAAARLLVDLKYTDSDHLALLGGSNGGLLMGAMITQHPQIARAVVSRVGIYDMLRVELDPNGEFNTTEFGTVKDRAQFQALYAYSPYHHVAKARYPAVLMASGANDGRVNPMQSRKFTAALQAASTSGRPVLLRISSTSGHGIGSSLSERIDETADWLSFLFDQLGMQQQKLP
jgi:prolyl oligopeptidase